MTDSALKEGRAIAPAEPDKPDRPLAKWAAKIDDQYIPSPSRVVKVLVLKEQASIPPEYVLVRDYDGEGDVPLKNDQEIDLGEGNVFYAVPADEVPNPGAGHKGLKFAYFVDGFVAIGGCDKNMPGSLMAMARMNRAAVFVYGGTILPGCLTNSSERKLDIVSVFEAIGAHANGRISDKEFHAVEQCAIPGPGSCGGMYTANTMASAIEALGMSLPNSSAQNAVSQAKRDDCRRAGACVVEMLKSGLLPLDILTKKAFENAITVVIALGGSTNAVLHLLGIAHAAKIKLSLDDFTRIGKRVPVLADLKPSGKHLMSELVASENKECYSDIALPKRNG